MATTLRPQDSDLEETELVRSPWNYDFFQALRLIQRGCAGNNRLGEFGSPLHEPVRLGVAPSLSFPASQIQSWDRPAGSRPVMRVNFLGLIGPLGVLPHSYTELVMDRQRARDHTLRDFLDLFHHRLLSLFYRAWEKHNLAASFERSEEDGFSQMLFHLIGLGTAGLRNRLEVPDQSLLFYAGLLSGRTRSAVGLEQLLTDYFDACVSVDQFIGAWQPIDPELQSSLPGDGLNDVPLGEGVLIGDEVWEQQSRFRIRIGPLPLKQYKDFLPGGHALKELRSLVEFYTGPELEMILQLVLRRDEAPACELQTNDGTAVQLGWTTWLTTRPMLCDPGDTILEENLMRLN